MSGRATGERAPWFAVKVDMPKHPKVLELPSHAARWGLVVLWSEAKQQRPSGAFRSATVARALLGDLARYLSIYLAAGLVHAVPFACPDPRCAPPFAELRPGAIVVHSWHIHQREVAARQADHRSRLSHAEVTPDVTPEDGPNPAVGHTYSRALSRVHSQVSSSRGVGGPGEGADPLDAVEAWLADRHARPAPGSATYTELARITDRHDAPKVIEAFEQLEQRLGVLSDGAQYVYGARKLLDPIPDVRGSAVPRKGMTSTEGVDRAVERV